MLVFINWVCGKWEMGKTLKPLNDMKFLFERWQNFCASVGWSFFTSISIHTWSKSLAKMSKRRFGAVGVWKIVSTVSKWVEPRNIIMIYWWNLTIFTHFKEYPVSHRTLPWTTLKYFWSILTIHQSLLPE